MGTIKKNLNFPRKWSAQRKESHSQQCLGSSRTAWLCHTVQRKTKLSISWAPCIPSPVDTSNEQRKPEVILTYNETKAGVDTMDQMTRTYSCKRKTRRWPLVVFYNILAISATNAYVIWKALNPNWNSNKSHKRRLCLLQLGKELARVSEEAIQKTVEQTRETASEPPRKKARCTICPSANDRQSV